MAESDQRPVLRGTAPQDTWKRCGGKDIAAAGSRRNNETGSMILQGRGGKDEDRRGSGANGFAGADEAVCAVRSPDVCGARHPECTLHGDLAHTADGGSLASESTCTKARWCWSHRKVLAPLM